MNPSSAVPQAAFTFGNDDPYSLIDGLDRQMKQDDVLAESMRGLLVPGKRQAYCLAGRAVVTVRSITTGTRFTLKIKRPDPKKELWMVALLSGPDNDADFQYMGIIVPRGAGFNFQVTKASKMKVTAPSMLAASFLATHFEDQRMEVWHEGRCGRCGRTLTVPESIASGIGPVCLGGGL